MSNTGKPLPRHDGRVARLACWPRFPRPAALTAINWGQAPRASTALVATRPAGITGRHFMPSRERDVRATERPLVATIGVAVRVRASLFPRVLDVRKLVELDVVELAVHLLDLADVDGLHDVSRFRI